MKNNQPRTISFHDGIFTGLEVDGEGLESEEVRSGSSFSGYIMGPILSISRDGTFPPEQNDTQNYKDYITIF